MFSCFFSGADSHISRLLHSASARVKWSLRPRTSRAYIHTFKKFLAFLLQHGLLSLPISPQVLLAFIEQQLQFGISHPTLCNNLSALKFMFFRFQWATQAFTSPLISRALKVIDISVRRTFKPKEIFSIQDLTDLVHLTASHPWGVALRAQFLLAFFAFLRISNLLPHSSLLLSSSLYPSKKGCCFQAWYGYSYPQIYKV